MITLICSSIDDEEEISQHSSVEKAIDAAAKWFSYGYENMPEVDISDDMVRLREELASGRDFFCGKFGERAMIFRT